jgi:hypothetical protein
MIAFAKNSCVRGKASYVKVYKKKDILVERQKRKTNTCHYFGAYDCKEFYMGKLGVYRRVSVKPLPPTSSTWDTITNATGSMALMHARRAGNFR